MDQRSSRIVVEYPATAIDPFAHAYLADPYPFHQQLRELGPVAWLSKYDAYVCARYDEVRAVLADPDSYCSGRGTGIRDIRAEGNWRTPSILLENDPPDHTRVRRALMSVLTPRNIRRLRDLFTAEAAGLVDRALARGTFDAVADLARPFPLHVFPDAVGITAPGREALLDYGRMVFDGMGPENEIYRQVMRGADNTVAWITDQCRRDALRPGGLGAQVFDVVDSGGLTEDEAILVVRSFLSAGVDTTIHALGSTLYCLARHPDQWRALRDDSTLVRFAFEEALRCESPFQQFFRTATRETRLGDVMLRPGDKILLIPASANRDPSHWDDPDRYDLRRKPSGHVAFGFGIHSCVGQMIARLEADVLLSEMVRRVRHIELAGTPQWQPSNTLRGLHELPVTIHPN